MKCCVCLVLLLSLVAANSDDARSLLFQTANKKASAESSSKATSTTTEGRAATSASASSTGGVAVAVAEATAEAFAQSESQLVTFLETVFKELDPKRSYETDQSYCKDALATLQADLKAVGSATAHAFTDAMAEVSVEGSGNACASAEASAQSTASSYAKVLAEAASFASLGTTVSQAEAAIDLTVTAIATAFSQALATACVEGEGFGLAVQTSLAEAIIEPIATVSVYLASGVDCRDQAGYATSEASAEGSLGKEDVKTEGTSYTELQGKGSTEATGITEAETSVLQSCSSTPGFYLCCRESSSLCTCSATSRPRCKAVRKTLSDGTTYWDDDEQDVKCTCSSAAKTSIRRYSVTIQT